MQYVIEKERAFSSLDAIQEAAQAMDVQCEPTCQLRDLTLTPEGRIVMQGISRPMTEIALRDALSRASLHFSSCKRYFEEGLDSPIASAANAYYKESKASGTQVKLITRAATNEECAEFGSRRVVIGLPSGSYFLFNHAQAVHKIRQHVSGDYQLRRARITPFFSVIGSRALPTRAHEHSSYLLHRMAYPGVEEVTSRSPG